MRGAWGVCVHVCVFACVHMYEAGLDAHAHADTSSEALSEYLCSMVRGALEGLEVAGCITLGGEDEEGGGIVEPTTAGRCAWRGYRCQGQCRAAWLSRKSPPVPAGGCSGLGGACRGARHGTQVPPWHGKRV